MLLLVNAHILGRAARFHTTSLLQKHPKQLSPPRLPTSCLPQFHLSISPRKKKEKKTQKGLERNGSGAEGSSPSAAMAGWCEEAVALLQPLVVGEIVIDVLLCVVSIWATIMIGLAVD